MSTASSFRTTVPEMLQASERVNEVSERVDADMRQLDSLIQPITSQWAGAAASAYMQLHATWLERQGRLRQVLQEISIGIKQNAQSYQVNEDQVQAAMQRTTGALG